MKILLITPALPSARAGNRVTAVRWRNILTDLGHQVLVKNSQDDIHQLSKQYDMMIALHAWRSANSIHTFNKRFPEKPLIVALTGTDLYRFIHSHPIPTLRSIKFSDALISLHDLAHLAIPKQYRKKVNVIYQSADVIKRSVNKNKKYFDVCVVGHLREEKDPLRAAYAVRKLPSESRIRVKQYGKAHTPAWAERAKKETASNSRYRWHGEVPHWKIRQQYAHADLMVLSSKMEGGANVISEACVAGMPVLASDIAGSIGLLGKSYPGYYPYGDTQNLRKLLLKAETDNKFLSKLEIGCKAKSNLFTYAKEKNNIKNLLKKVL